MTEHPHNRGDKPPGRRSVSVNRDWQARALNGSLPRELLVRLLSDSYKHAGAVIETSRPPE